MRRLLVLLSVAAVVCGAIFWWLSSPSPSGLLESRFSNLTSANIENGEQVFWASGCASCHAADKAEGDERLKLGGGHRLQSPFGTFVAPNISQDKEHGIGGWEFKRFALAMTEGLQLNGSHYFPSFPYGSYSKMKPQDIADLWSYLKTLPAVDRPSEPHDLPIVFQWRRPVGIWKRLFQDNTWVTNIAENDPQFERGRYLVEALGHCGECHTPRNLLGGLKRANWLAGGPSPDGKGRVPNITPHEDGIGAWSETDIAYYLESGFTPEYDSAGGSMASVVENFSRLSEEDRLAVAKYLKSILAVPSD